MSGKTINPNNAPATVLIKRTSTKATPLSGGERFNSALSAAGGNLVAGVESAASFLPGGGALSAAIRGARGGTGGGILNTGNGLGYGGGGADGMVYAKSGNNYGYADGTTITKGTDGNGYGSDPGTTPDGDSTGSEVGDLARNAGEMLALQIEVQKVSNTFTARSNVLKTDHETKRGVIRNMA